MNKKKRIKELERQINMVKRLFQWELSELLKYPNTISIKTAEQMHGYISLKVIDLINKIDKELENE